MDMSIRNSAIVLGIIATLSLVGNYVATKVGIFEAMPGMLILMGLALIGILLGEVLPFKIPSVAYIVTLSTIITIPGFPGSEIIYNYVSKVNFLALCTPILAYAGIYTGKNVDSLKKTGPKIFILALFVIAGTFLGSAIIANFVLKLIGTI